MAKLTYVNGQTSLILRVFIPDTTSVIGGGKTGLVFSSAGLIISTIADNEASATTYTQAGSTIETITTLGTFAAPTATKCRFKEVDATNHPGLYEIQIADARWAVSSARSLIVSLPPVSGLGTGPVRAEVQLWAVNPQDAVRAGLTALPNAAAGASGGVPTLNSNLDVQSDPQHWKGGAIPTPAVTGVPIIDLKYILGTVLTETSGQIAAAFKKFFNIASPTSTMNQITLVDTTTTLTNAPPDSAGVTTLLARMGAFTGTGVNTVLGFLKAVMRKDATLPSDIGGTYDVAADSLEALQDSGISGGGSVDATKINGSASAAAKLALSAVSIISGTAASGTLTTTQLTTNLSETNTDQYVGRAIVFTSGVLVGQAATITAYLPTGGKLTVTELTDAPSNGDTFVIV